MKKSITYKVTGAPLPIFCQKCGFAESAGVHHGETFELVEAFPHEMVYPHKFISGERKG
jgi:hypothetical protein